MTAAARLIRVPFPAGLVILSRRRRISVHDVSGTAAVKCQSAGRSQTLRASFPAGLVIRGRSAEESWYLPLVIHRPLNASRRTADSGKLSHRITSSPAHWPTHLPYTSKASLAGGFFGDVGLLRKIGNNEWNHHGQWRFPFCLRLYDTTVYYHCQAYLQNKITIINNITAFPFAIGPIHRV